MNADVLRPKLFENFVQLPFKNASSMILIHA